MTIHPLRQAHCQLDVTQTAGPAPPGGPPGAVAGVPVAKAAAGVAEGDEAAAVSSKLFRCACVRRLLPLVYREELYHVLRLAGPVLVSRILNFLLPFVITIFCGHIGNSELAGYALASAFINVTAASTGYGLALASDTLISQTFGKKNLKRVGVILQRSMMILLLFCLPCWALLINSHNALLLIHQEHEVARVAQVYMMAYLPAVPALYLHILQVSYLQNQGIILPQMYTAAAANIINLGVNYVLIFSLELGMIGSAIANSFSQITICLLLYGWIRWRKLHKQTWAGWSSDSLQEWGSYMQLAIPSILMTCFEWWVWEIGGFLAGILGEVDLAAQHVMCEVGAITYMFPLGVHVAAVVRVGNALGAGNTARALVTCKVTLCLAGVIAVFQGIVLFASRSVIGYIFTSDKDITDIVAENLIIYTFIPFFEAFMCICQGILIGSGMQKICAVSSLVFYFLIGLPLGAALMFYAKLRVLGFWLGVFVCTFIQTGFLVTLVFKLNWKKITQEAQLRAGKTVLVPSKRPVSMVGIEAFVPDLTDTAPLEGEEAPPTPAGYSAVSTQDQEQKLTQDQEQKLGHEAEGSNKEAAGTQGDTERSKTAPDIEPEARLSVSQIVLRRGFTVLVTVLILAIGVAVHFVFPPPEPSAESRTNFTLDWANNSTPTSTTPLELSTPL